MSNLGIMSIRSQRPEDIFLREMHSYFNELKNSLSEYLVNDRTYVFKVFLLGTVSVLFYGSLYFSNTPIWYLLGVLFYSAVLSSLILNVIHDAAHGVIFKSQFLNDLSMHLCFATIGASGSLWKFEHNVEHHRHTNVLGVDGSIVENDFIRLHSSHQWRWYHRFQAWYAPILYCVHLIDFYFISELEQFWRYYSDHGESRDLFLFIFSRIIHISLMLLLPLLFAQVSWIVVLLGFFLHLMIHSLILVLLIGLNHLNMEVKFFNSESSARSEGNIYHQLLSTVDFGVNNIWISHLLGGFNLHAIHHVFPGIHQHMCHRSQPKFMEKADELGLPYRRLTYAELVRSHFEYLSKLSRPQEASLN